MISEQAPFAGQLEMLKRAWESHGIHCLVSGRGAFMKLRTFYFVREEFEEVLRALQSLPSVESGLPPIAIRYLWRMNEFLLIYRDNYIPRETTNFLSTPVDIRDYDEIQAKILGELNRILGSAIEEV
jgi:hypothetical protein